MSIDKSRDQNREKYERVGGGPLLVNTNKVAELLNLSPRTVWRLLSAGKLPKPVRIGRSVRWSLTKLESWIAEGCPALKNGSSVRRIPGVARKQTC
jgi:excisionase family DNA binding protein